MSDPEPNIPDTGGPVLLFPKLAAQQERERKLWAWCWHHFWWTLLPTALIVLLAWGVAIQEVGSSWMFPAAISPMVLVLVLLAKKILRLCLEADERECARLRELDKQSWKDLGLRYAAGRAREEAEKQHQKQTLWECERKQVLWKKRKKKKHEKDHFRTVGSRDVSRLHQQR